VREIEDRREHDPACQQIYGGEAERARDSQSHAVMFRIRAGLFYVLARGLIGRHALLANGTIG
jgi:hypothetical protein